MYIRYIKNNLDEYFSEKKLENIFSMLDYSYPAIAIFQVVIKSSNKHGFGVIDLNDLAEDLNVTRHDVFDILLDIEECGFLKFDEMLSSNFHKFQITT